MSLIDKSCCNDEIQSPSKFRLSLASLNPHITCILCRGYMVDATTIVECLHSFCRTCIYRHLESSKFCPVCEVQVHKTKPLLNVRPDKTMQSLVYKLVPGLFKDEMRRRKEFYPPRVSSDKDSKMMTGSPDDKSLYTSEFRTVLEKDNFISLCLERSDRLPSQSKSQGFSRIVSQLKADDRRFLLCPAGLTIGHLKRFIRFKLDLPPDFHVDVFHSDEALKEFYTLQEIANIYTWRQTSPLQLYYVLYSVLFLGKSCDWNASLVYTENTLTAVRPRFVSSVRHRSRGIKYVDSADEDETRAGNTRQLTGHSRKCQPWKELEATIEDSQDSCSIASDATIMDCDEVPRCDVDADTAECQMEMAEMSSLNNVECRFDSGAKPKCRINNTLYCGIFQHSPVASGAPSRCENDCVLMSVPKKDLCGIPSDSFLEHERLLNPIAVTNSQTDTFENCVNCSDVDVADKIGFEAEALSASARQWEKDCLGERRCQLKAKRVHSEVRRLFIDENTPGAKRELRSYRRKVNTSAGNDRLKNRNPLRSRAVLRIGTNRNRLSRLVTCKKTSDSQKLD